MHVFDAQAEAQIALLSRVSGADVVICADERSGPVDTGGWPKVGITSQSLESLDLHPHERAGWQCGDYVYYHVLAHLPQYDFYWMVEPDVFIGFREVSDLFAIFRDARQDLIAPKLGPRPRRWGWTDAVSDGDEPVFGACVQFTRLSAPAIASLHRARSEARRRPGPKEGRAWPNDEAFIGTMTARLGYTSCDVNAVSPVPIYRPETFRTGNPILLDDVLSRPDADLLLHPVLPREKYLAKLRRSRNRGVPLTPENTSVLTEYFGADTLREIASIEPAGRFRKAPHEAGGTGSDE